MVDRPVRMVFIDGTDLSVSCEMIPGRLDIMGDRGYFVLSRDEVRKLVPYLVYFADNGTIEEQEP